MVEKALAARLTVLLILVETVAARASLAADPEQGNHSKRPEVKHAGKDFRLGSTVVGSSGDWEFIDAGISRDGSLILTRDHYLESALQRIQVWDSRTGTLKSSIVYEGEEFDRAFFCLEDEYIVVFRDCRRRNRIDVWHWKARLRVATWEDLLPEPCAVGSSKRDLYVFAMDGSNGYLLDVLRKKTIAKWRIQLPNWLKEVPPEKRSPLPMVARLREDGKRVLIGWWQLSSDSSRIDYQCAIYDCRPPQLVKVLRFSDDSADIGPSLQVSSDLSVVVFPKGERLQVLDTTSGKVQATLRYGEADSYRISQSGKYIALSEEGMCTLWRVADGRCLGRCPHSDWRLGPFSSDDNCLLTVGLLGARAWDIRNNATRPRIARHWYPVRRMRISGKDVLVSLDQNGAVVVWDLRRRKVSRVIPFTAKQRMPSRYAWCSDFAYIDLRAFRVIALEKNRELSIRSLTSGTTRTVQLPEHGILLFKEALLSEDGQIFLVPDGWPSGNRLRRKRYLIVNLRTNRTLFLPNSKQWSGDLVFRPGTHEIAISTVDGGVVILDASRGTKQRYMPGLKDLPDWSVHSLSFDSTGKKLFGFRSRLLGSREMTTTMIVWDVDRGKLVRSRSIPMPPQYLGDMAQTFIVSPTGKLVAVVNNQWARVIDAATGRHCVIVRGSFVGPAVFSTDERWLYVARRDSTIAVIATDKGLR